MQSLGTIAIRLVITILIIITTLHSYKNKKYINVFIPGLLFLPDYYGIDINDKLPIISVSRIMYLIFFSYVLINKRKPISFSLKGLKKASKEFYFLVAFFIIRIISNLYYVPQHSESIKAIAYIVFEVILLIYGLYLLSPTKEELIDVAKSVVYVSGFIFFVGIFESLTGIRPLDSLYTVNREVFNDHYIRLGLLRATTTLCIPNYLGNICLVMFPLICYLHRLTKHKRYVLIGILDLLALIHVGSRSTIIFYIGILVLYIVFTIIENKDVKSTIRAIIIAGVITFAWIFLACAFDENAEYYYTGTGKSLLNIVGFDFDLSSNAPKNSGGYGLNETTATYSRVYQFSGAKNAIEKNPLFGLGAGCVERGEFITTWQEHTGANKSVDSALVEIIIYEGLLGLFAYVLLYVFFIMSCIKRRIEPIHNHEDRVLFLILLSYTITLTVTTTMPRLFGLIMFLFIYNINNSQEVE